MENADLLTNAAAALEWARSEEQQLEIEVSIAQAKLEQVRELVTRLSGKPRARRGRPPGPKLVDPLGQFGVSSQLGRSSQLGVGSQLNQRHDGNISQPEPETAA